MVYLGKAYILSLVCFKILSQAHVTQWLNKSGGTLPLDIWIEVIPYRETRAYVRNILMYSIIYSRKMGQRPPLLMRNEIYRLL